MMQGPDDENANGNQKNDEKKKNKRSSKVDFTGKRDSDLRRWAFFFMFSGT